MKILVTGATGFIGRYVVAELLSRDHQVVAVARNQCQAPNMSSCGRVEFVACNLYDPALNLVSTLGLPPDAMIHLAWSGLPNYKSLHHFEDELPAQYRFLKKMVEFGLKKLVVTGTCFEYGMQSGALSEDLLSAPISSYGYAKDALRQQLEFFGATYSFRLIWARLFYMYGDGQLKDSLFPQIQNAVVRGDKVFNMSGGEQLRDYLPVKEVARLIVELALHSNENGTVNICAGKPISVRHLVETWIQANNWEITLNLGYYPYPDYEPMAFWGDRSRLDMLLI